MITWKFKLTSDCGQLNFGSELVKNYDDISVSVMRNKELRGATIQFSNVFEFVGAARSFIKATYDLGGIDASLYLQMWIGNESGHKSSFKRLGDPIKGSFGKTYQLDETSAKMSFASNEFEELILNRFDTEIEYDIEEAIDGQDIGTPIYHNIAMHDRIINGTATMDASAIFNKTTYYTLIGFTSKTNNTQIVHDVTPYAFTGSTPEPPYKLIASVENGTQVHISIKNMILNIVPNYGSKENHINFRISNKRYTSDGQDPIIYFEQISPTAYKSQTMTVNCELDLILNQGETVMMHTYQGPVAENSVNYTCNDVTITVNSPFPPTASKCILPFEAFDRQLAKITGQKNTLISNFIGRQNLGYSEDGEGSYVALMNGKLIRSFPTIESKIRFSLKDLWKTYRDAFNLVAWVKDGKFYIEKYEDYYDLNNVMMLTEAVTSLTFNIIESDHFSNIKYGCNNVSYEEVNELDTFAGTYERQTPIKSVDNKLDLIIPYRTDDYGPEFTRRKPYANYPTEGYRTDDENFLIDSKPNGNMSVITKQGGEGLEVSGILSPNTAYNIALRPSNLLKNWYNVIASGTYHQVGKMIKFVRGAKNTKLVVDGLAEIRDIEISELGYPLLLPEMIEFEAKLTTDQFNRIILEPNLIIGVGKAFGIIDKMDYNPNTGKAEFKLIRANR